MCGCGFVVAKGSRSREGSLAARSPEAYQEPPGAAKAERKRHGVSLGGPRGTLARRSCPTDEGPLPLRPRSCRSSGSPRGGVPLWVGVCWIAPG